MHGNVAGSGLDPIPVPEPASGETGDMAAPASLPVLAIVGRPNVGKSAIFNVIVGRRLAIVHEERGVTRDRLSAETAWEGKPFRLVDTGGIGDIDGARAVDTIGEGVRRQAEAAIAEADALIQVVDVQDGLTPLDIEVSRLLRVSGRPVFLAANKADNETLAGLAVEFAPLGYDIFPVSALHRQGIGELMDRATEGFSADAREGELDTRAPLRVAVLGRPNAGKSSFINALLGEERVIVSELPGTTRDSIEIPFTIGKGPGARSYLLCDTAGLRPRSKVREAVEHFSHIRVEDAVRRTDIAALLFDATLGPTRQDKRIAALVQSAQKACVLIVNKWDLVGNQKQKTYAAAVQEALPFLAYAPMVFLSARTGYRIRSAVGLLDRVAAAYAKTVTTGVLNRTLHAAFERTRPPAVQGHPLKFYYATQTGVRPPRFRLFVNDPDRLVEAYRLYLVRRLREAFGFEGAPLALQFVPRGSKR